MSLVSLPSSPPPSSSLLNAFLPADPTLDEMRVALAPRIPVHAGFDGWTFDALDRAAIELSIDPAIARLAFPSGAVDMIDAWFAAVDSHVSAVLSDDALAAMKIRDRITNLILARISAVHPHKEALRRAYAILAMPQNIARATAFAWRSADYMWQRAGDISTDYNHYTKRMILSGVYGSTMMVFLQDNSVDYTDTRAFLARRIDNVMQFEKTKAQFVARHSHRPSLSRFIGRLRYPAV